MGSAADLLATATLGAEPVTPPVGLVSGVVISLGPPIRVRSLGRDLSCSSLVGVDVGNAVWVISIGNENVILGVDTSTPLVFRKGPINAVTNASSEFVVTYVTPFPNVLEGIIVSQAFGGTDLAAVLVQSTSSPTTNTVHLRHPETNVDVGAGFTFIGNYFAWGH